MGPGTEGPTDEAGITHRAYRTWAGTLLKEPRMQAPQSWGTSGTWGCPPGRGESMAGVVRQASTEGADCGQAQEKWTDGWGGGSL